MKLNYYADRDSLYIDLAERPSAKAERSVKVLFLIMTLKAIWWALTSIMLAEKLISRSSRSISYRGSSKQIQANYQMRRAPRPGASCPKLFSRLFRGRVLPGYFSRDKTFGDISCF